jgi:hypothetical protein
MKKFGQTIPQTSGAQMMDWYDNLRRTAKRRSDYTRNMAWAIPCDRAVSLIAKFSPIVEIGAGSGLWARKLRRAGADVVAYDVKPAHKRGRNRWVDRSHTPILIGGVSKVRKHPNRALFLCWPPYNEPMASDCLKLYRGSTVIYIGEGWRGCTGDNRFHELLDDHWDQIDECELDQWYGMHDRLTIWTRK